MKTKFLILGLVIMTLVSCNGNQAKKGVKLLQDAYKFRGGSYLSKDTKCWVFYREKKKSVETSSELGFRLVY